MGSRRHGCVTFKELEEAIWMINDLDEYLKEKILIISELDKHMSKGCIKFQPLMETCVMKELLNKQ